MANLTAYNTDKLKEAFSAAIKITPSLASVVFDFYHDKNDPMKLSHRVEVFASRARSARFRLNGECISKSELQKHFDSIMSDKGWSLNEKTTKAVP